MARTLEQLLEQEKSEVVAEAKLKASEMLRIVDKQTTAKQDHKADSDVSLPKNNKGPDELAFDCSGRTKVAITTNVV
nr:hypothetical protein [Proteus mirabilis]